MNSTLMTPNARGIVMQDTMLVYVTCLFSIAAIAPASAQWVQTNKPNSMYVFGLADSGAHIYAGGYNISGNGIGGVYLTTDEGEHWNSTGLTTWDFNSISVSGVNVFVGTDSGVYCSMDNGTTWAAADTGLGTIGKAPFYLYALDTEVYAGTPGAIYISTNNGATWVSSDLGAKGDFMAFAESGVNLYAGTFENGVYLSSDNGEYWTSAGLTTEQITTFAVAGNYVFAGTENALFRSSENNIDWLPVTNGIPECAVTSLAVSGANIFAGTDSGVYLSTDNGANWQSVNAGLPGTIISSIIISDSILYAVINDTSVWRRPLSDMITTVKEQDAAVVPVQQLLAQNYPNPFDAATTITYLLPEPSQVSLKVFNALGEYVATLVNGFNGAGLHSATFNVLGVPNGVYFYRLAAGKYVQNHTMVVQK